MKMKYARIMGVLATLVLVAGLTIGIPSSASATDNKFMSVGLPSATTFVLGVDTDLGPGDVGSDGTLWLAVEDEDPNIICSKVDINDDDNIDGTDDGTLLGIEVIDGLLDMDEDGYTGDDGWFWGEAVIDGLFDIDGDGTAGEMNGDDDDSISGKDVINGLLDMDGDGYTGDYGTAVAAFNNWDIINGLFDIDGDGTAGETNGDDDDLATLTHDIINGLFDIDGDGTAGETNGDDDDTGTYAYDVLNGKVDLDDDGDIGNVDSDDDGTHEGVDVYDGMLDRDNDGDIDGIIGNSDSDDDGNVIIADNWIGVIDGYLDMNGDTETNCDDSSGCLPSRGWPCDWALVKSTDGGRTWKVVLKPTDCPILDVDVSDQDPNTVWVTTPNTIYRTGDAGTTFPPEYARPIGAGEFTCLDTMFVGSAHLLLAGTESGPGSQLNVVMLDEADSVPNWEAKGNAAWSAAIAVTFLPPNDWTDHRGISAVGVVGDDAEVAFRFGVADWDAHLGTAYFTDGGDARRAFYMFGTDSNFYSADSDYYPVLFVGFAGSSGLNDLFRVDAMPFASVATDLQTPFAGDPDIGGNPPYGPWSGSWMGPADTGECWLGSPDASNNGFGVKGTKNGGASWTAPVLKQPTGSDEVWILNDPDFMYVYAATEGSNSAFNVGMWAVPSFHQWSFVDATICDLVKFQVYCDGTNTWGWLIIRSCDCPEDVWSLWRTNMADSATPMWERVHHWGDPVTISYADGTLWAADFWDNCQTEVWYSNDPMEGVNFAPTISSPVNALSPSGPNESIDIPRACVLKAVSATEVAFGAEGDCDESGGYLIHTTNKGLTWSAYGGGNLGSATSIDHKDGAWLFGNDDHEVWYSANRLIWYEIPSGGGPFTGDMYVTFGADNTMFYAVDGKKAWRFNYATAGRFGTWTQIDGSPQSVDEGGGILFASDGTLYTADIDGELGRSLNPSKYPGYPVWEQVTYGVPSGAELWGVWACESECVNKVWTIDINNDKLLLYVDALICCVEKVSPEDGAVGISPSGVMLTWEALGPATSYWVGINTRSDWKGLGDYTYTSDTFIHTGGFSGLFSDDCVGCELASGGTYYWNVKASQPVFSRLCAPWSFTVLLTERSWHPGLDPSYTLNIAPMQGAILYDGMVAFGWNGASTGDGYELKVSTSADMTSLVIDLTGANALGAGQTAYRATSALDPGTYYWQVRATRSDGTYSAWSDVYVFVVKEPPTTPTVTETNTKTVVTTPTITQTVNTVTVVQPAPTTITLTQVPEPTPATPAYVWVIIVIGGVLLIVVIVLIVRTRRV